MERTVPNPYTIGATIIVFLGLVAGLLFYRGEAISAKAAVAQAQADLVTAKGVNDALATALKEAQRQADLANKVTADLVASNAKIDAGVAATNQKLADLEKSNAALRDFLGTVVPPDLWSLYDDQQDSSPASDGGKAPSARCADSALPAC